MNHWRYVQASSKGTAHAVSDVPCQDRALSQVLIDDDGQEIFIAAVADGAGSACRSEYGAEIATKLICRKLEKFLRQSGTLIQISRDDIEQWLAQISDQISELANEEGLSRREYACTLLVAAVSPAESLFLQIGDGTIVIGSEGSYRPVFWPMTGEYANSTYFVTDDSALNRVQFELISNESIEDIALMSDGLQGLALQFATRTVHAPFFKPMFTRLAEEANPGLSEVLCRSLEIFLNSKTVCDRTDDDKTLVLATCYPIQPLQVSRWA